MAWIPFSTGRSWRGPDGEDEMSPEDWQQRGLEQAQAMREGGDAFQANPDEDSDPTGGYYNGDYPDSWHDELNQRLETDDGFAEQTRADIGRILRADTERRADQDS